MSVGVFFFGITVTYSSFQIIGQTDVTTILLYIDVRGMARKSANSVIKVGNTSPRTIDFGFWKCLIRAATLCRDSIAIGDENVDGISEGSKGRNSLEIALKCPAKTFATSKSVIPGNSDLGSNCFGRSFDW